MKAPGHTILLTKQAQPMGDVLIALECTCGTVLTRGLFPVDDPRHREAVFDDGKALAREHLAQTLVLNQS